MKKVILGVQPVNYKKRGSGEQVNGVTLYLSNKSADTFGVKTSDLYISSSKACYSELVPFLDKGNDLIGLECDVEYNEKGFLENFTLEC